MDHDHGHWFVVGVLLSGALVVGVSALRALFESADLGVSPEAFLGGMITIGAICVGKWWFENRE